MKSEYIEFSKSHNNASVFHQPWWLDAVCGHNNWDVILYKNKSEIIAFYTYFKKKKFCLNLATVPYLSLLNGPYIHDKNISINKIHDIQYYFINSIRDKSFININTDENLVNLLPYIWDGYTQTSRISYSIDLTRHISFIYENLGRNIKYDIDKSKNKFNNRVTYNIDINEFYEILYLSYKSKGIVYHHSFELICNILKSSAQNNSLITVGITNESGKLICANVLIISGNRAYYLIGASMPSFKHQGISSHCMWESIIASKCLCSIFDFEGSMIQGIEKYFRSFGSTPYIINNLTKFNNKFLRLPYEIFS